MSTLHRLTLLQQLFKKSLFLIGLTAVFMLLNTPDTAAQRAKKKTATKQQPAPKKAKSKAAPVVKAKQKPAQVTPARTPAQRKPVSRRRQNAAETSGDEEAIQKSRQQLEAEKRQNQERIREINRVLNQTSTKKTATLTELKALNSKIETKEKQIDLLEQDLNLLKVEMKGLRTTSGKLSKDLVSLKKEYASMVYAASKTANTYNKLSFLFSANSFNSLVMRYQYLRQYTKARETQAQHIERVRAELNTKQQTLKYKQVRQADVINVQVSETKSLEQVKERQASVVTELNKQESTLKSELEERIAATNRLDNMIAAVIERQIREREERLRRERIARQQAEEREAARIAAAKAAAAERAREAAAAERAAANKPAASKPAAAEKEKEEEEAVAKVVTPVIKEKEVEEKRVESVRPIGLAPEAEVGASFGSSRGKLPWPVRSGYISEHFGIHTIAGTKLSVRNSGVDIATNVGEPVRAVYDGIVQSVMTMPGMGKIVAIQHGEFFTVYAKLASTAVSTGQRVKAREAIGTAMADRDGGGGEINFQIWKGSGGKVNPESWLAGK